MIIEGWINMFEEFLEKVINDKLIVFVVSNPRKNDVQTVKYKIRPIALGAEIKFQVESFTVTQSFHKNLTGVELKEALVGIFRENLYKQMDVYTMDLDYHLLVNKKGGVHKTEDKASMVQQDLGHNRKKQYVLEEGQDIPFLVQLGIMTKDGKVVQKRYDKFRQINRYLEMVEDVLPHLDKKELIRIIDFGCGKSYLTFALYHYLVVVKQYAVEIVGLDLKADVIAFCNQLAQDLRYEHLAFQVGDIGAYRDEQKVDMVITLHACDTATDMALQKAVGWGAKVIMSVPCCQHELNGQIKCEALEDILKYGIIKERISALMTDAMRANWLEIQGYEVQILEFIDLEHTPKNLLIRAVKSEVSSVQEVNKKKFRSLEAFLNSDLTIKTVDALLA